MKPFTAVASLLLALIALVHLLRMVLAWPVLVNGVAIPMWISAVALVVSFGLAVMLWREARV
jgi:hypothetical protein